MTGLTSEMTDPATRTGKDEPMVRADQLGADQLVIALHDIPERVAHPRALGRRPVLVFRDGTEVYAVAGRCTHHGVELAGGRLTGALLRCPWHGATFDLRTGARLSPPQCRDLRTYPVRVVGDQVLISSDAASASDSASDSAGGQPA